MTPRKSSSTNPSSKSSQKAQKPTSHEVNENKLKSLKETQLNQKISQLEAELSVAQKEIEDWKSKSLRFAADLQNAVRQNEIDIATSKKNAKKNTLLSVIPFLNTLNIAFSYIPSTEDAKVITFINTLKSSFEKVINDLQLENVHLLVCKPGALFNPETMTILNSDISVDNEVKVKQVVSIGLKIDNQLIQPISVIVE
jgi:molecular chaperone GrpE (heat shock protein)